MLRSLALLGFAALVGSVQDPAKPPAEEYQERLKAIQDALANEHFKIGDYLATATMHRWAREEFRKAIGFNPEHEEARKRLGYIKSAGEWEPDPNAALETDNKRKGDVEEGKVKKEYDTRVERLGRTIGKMWGETGNFCDRNKMKAEAEAAWKKAIEYDPANSDSRKKLGYTKQKDGPWLSKFEIAFRKEMKEGLAKSPSGQPDKAQTQVEQDLGFKHEKRKSKHFLIEVADQNQEWLADEVKHGELAYGLFHKLFDVKDDLFQQEFNLVVLKDKAAHEAYVDKYMQSADRTRREFSKKNNGLMGFPISTWIIPKHDKPEVHDWVVHVTVMMLFDHMVGGARPWMREGMAYHFTKTMLGSAGVMCVNLAGTGSGGEKNLQKPEDWPLVLKTWIKEGKDPNIAEVFKCKEVAELSGAETVKGWSIIEFLIIEHRERFIEYLSKLRGQKEEEDEKTLKEVFGWTLDDLDLRWKTYARSAY